MTDNTNPTTPKDNPIRALFNALTDSFSLHIEGLVERKVNEIFQSHATMALIDDKMKDYIADMVEEKVTEHEQDYEHPSNDDVVDMIGTQIAHTDLTDKVKYAVLECMSDNAYPDEDRVADLITQGIEDADLEEKVKEVLRNI